MVRPLVIVGDGPEVERLEQLLAEWGWACLRAPEEEVTSTLARTKPPLLLLGLRPGAEALTAARGLTQRIRATAYGALVPMVFFGPGPAPSSVDVLCLGGDAFLSLPGDPSAIRSCVQRLAGDPVARDQETQGSAGARSRGAQATAKPTPTPSPSPSREGSLDDLDRLGALPWEDLPDVSAGRRRLANGPSADPLDLDSAMAGDSLMDPRTLAAAIAREAQSSVADEDRPEDPDGGAGSSPDLRPDAGGPSDTPDPEWTRTSAASPADEEDDLVSQLAARGQESDTVAVRIQKAIEAFDAGELPPRTEREAAPGPTPPRRGTPKSRARRERPVVAAPEDGIDLSALDMDTIAGVEVGNPDALLDRLSQHTPPPASVAPGPVTTVTTSSGGHRPPSGRSATGIGLSLSGLASLPGPVGGSLPGPIGGSLSGISLGDDEPTQPPFLHPGESPQEALDDPLGPAPVASPYDLPPVVAGIAPSTLVMERGYRDRRDTVPGRRTAILQGVKPDPDEEPYDPGPAVMAEITRPESPTSRRSRSGRGRATRPPAPSAGPPPPPAMGSVPADLREGNLNELDPARLLLGLGEVRATGTLRVEAPEGALELLFQEGRIRFASSTRPGDRMLALLARSGLISESQAEEVEAQIASSGRRAGAILLDQGWIRPAELIPSIREHLEHLVMAVFGLEEGPFVFRAEWPTAEEIVHIERELPSLVFEGVRRKYTPARVRRLVGADEARPVKHAETDESVLAGCALTGKDWRLLDAMDGRRTLGELGTAMGVDPHHLWSLAYFLYAVDLVALSAEAGARDAGDAHPSAPRGPLAQDGSLEVEVQRILRRLDLAREGDYFAVLGAAPDATAAEIAQAFARTRQAIADPRIPAVLEGRFTSELGEIRAVLQEAFDVLGEERLRERYRRFLAAADDTEA